MLVSAPTAGQEAIGADGQYTAVSAGGDHPCALTDNGTVTCWGNNYYGQTEASAGRFTAISAGHWTSCGLRIGGAIECWGRLAIVRPTA